MERRYTIWSLNQEMPSQFQDTVTSLIETLINPERLKRDLFFAMLLIVMRESNFVLLRDICEAISIVDYISTKKTKIGNDYEALLILDGFVNTPVKLIACPLADTLLINATVPQVSGDCYSICLKISSYISQSQWGIPIDFLNFNELCRMFKDQIVTPIKSLVLNHHSFPSGSLIGLPDDIFRQILHKLPVKDVLNLSETCQRIYRVAKDDRLWSQLYGRDFPDNHKTEDRRWCYIYKDVYLTQRKQKYKVVSNRATGSLGEAAELSNYMSRARDSRWEVIL